MGKWLTDLEKNFYGSSLAYDKVSVFLSSDGLCRLSVIPDIYANHVMAMHSIQSMGAARDCSVVLGALEGRLMYAFHSTYYVSFALQDC